MDDQETEPVEEQRSELSAISEKKNIPPITFLQEICSRNGFTYERQLLSTEGSVHEPTFKIAVTVDNITVTASGQSKKKAKHAAAREAIEKLRQRTDLNFDGINFECLGPLSDTNPATTSLVSSNGSNPVGKLQEFCMKMRVNPPDYDTWDEKGLAHERIFKISCRIASLNLITFGEGRSKKLAKRHAAEVMLEKLVELEIYERTTKNDQNQRCVMIDENDNMHFVQNRCRLKKTISTLNTNAEELLKDIEMIYEDDVQEDLFYTLFQETATQVGYCQFQYLSDCHCLLHVFDTKNYPLLTSFGTGTNNIETMRDAVINANKQLIAFMKPSIRTARLPTDRRQVDRPAASLVS